MTRHWRGTASLTGILAIVTCSILAACGPTTSHASSNGSLTIEGANGTYVDNFNPYSPNCVTQAHSMIYEPLYFFDEADASKASPWLAQSYAWSNSGKTLTFTLRKGVKWSDGVPFNSADVAFTFNLEKNNPALNQYGIPFASITTVGQYKVAVNFTKSAYEDLDYLAGLTYILPQHIWKTIKDPATWADPKPVGTGAYEVSSVSSDVVTFTANPHYYMPGLPKIKTIQAPSFSSNTSSDLAISSGEVDWGSAYIPNITKDYTDRNSNYLISNIPVALEFLVPNMQSGPTASLPVREAISAAIDRSYVSKVVYQGYAGPTNPEGVLRPNFNDILDPSLASAHFTYSVAAAKKILQDAGYTMGSNGYFEKDGKELTVSVLVGSPLTDYVQSLQIIAAEEKLAGINLVIDSVSEAEEVSDWALGKFQMTINNYGYTTNPYVFFDSLIDGSSVPPEGKEDTGGDYGRYNNATVDSLLNKINASPSLNAVLDDYYQIEQIFKANLPLIPLFNQQDEVEFNGNVVTGEPTPSNPYSTSAGWISPDLGWTAMRLTLKGN
jgi:peptide/nickel transport system substrate-binding protein